MLSPLSHQCRPPVRISVSDERGSGTGYRSITNLSLSGWYVS
jgi:hypothetical protein